MDMNAAELVIARARNVPLSGARHGSGLVRPLVLAQSFLSCSPQPVVAAMPKFLVEMRFPSGFERSITQIEIGMAMVNFIQMR